MHIGDDTLYCPPLPLLWADRSGTSTPAEALHRAYLKEIWGSRGAVGRALLVLRFATWPFILAGASAYMTWRNGRAIARRTGRGTTRQVVDQVAIAARYGIMPPWYYMFELYRDENRARAGDYLHRFETKYNLYFLIKAHLERGDGRILADKEAFGLRCVEHGIATPPIIAVAENGTVRAPRRRAGGAAVPVRFTHDDLFIKPRKGKGGRGTLRATRVGEDSYRLSDGSSVSEAGLRGLLETSSSRQALLVQARLVNHADMLDMCADALCCVRILTCRNQDGGIEVTNAAFRMALRNDTTVDGLHRGGIAANVDVDSGRLGPATNLGLTPEIGWCHQNPATGVPIAGRILPMWAETCALAIRAHAMLPHKVMVGWDMAITPDGPVVVEGNGAPCVDIIQRVTCEPLGAGRFGALLAWHVDRAIEVRDRAELVSGHPVRA